MSSAVRHLILVLGDQLDVFASVWDDFDATQDAVWMAEVDEESTHVISSKQRTALFLSAMRHFAAILTEQGKRVFYTHLDGPNNSGTLAGELDKIGRAHV